MRPIKFPQVNRNLLKPEGMTDEECGTLPVYNDGTTSISLWKMTWKERISALIFGRIWLYVVSGATQPPVALEATKDLFYSQPYHVSKISGFFIGIQCWIIDKMFDLRVFMRRFERRPG